MCGKAEKSQSSEGGKERCLIRQSSLDPGENVSRSVAPSFLLNVFLVPEHLTTVDRSHSTKQTHMPQP